MRSFIGDGDPGASSKEQPSQESIFGDNGRSRVSSGREVPAVAADDQLILERCFAFPGPVVDDTTRAHHFHHAGGVLGGRPSFIYQVAKLAVPDTLDLADLR